MADPGGAEINYKSQVNHENAMDTIQNVNMNETQVLPLEVNDYQDPIVQTKVTDSLVSAGLFGAQVRRIT